MKKIVSIVSVVLMLVCLIAIYVSAEVTYISDLQIPYAVTAPVLDGTLSTGEWTDAAKFELPSSKMMVVQMNGLATTAPADLVINTYMKWDETYLYIATEVTGDKNGGRLYYGADGDNLALYLDVDGIAANNGNTDCHTFMVYSFPVVASAGSSDATGYHTRYNQADHEGSPDKLVQTDAGCSGSGTGWIIEQRIKWSDLDTLLGGAYEGQNLPTPKEGTVITFMPSYHDCNENNAFCGWYLGQNSGYTYNDGEKDVEVTWAACAPTCYGFRGTLAAKTASPDTADMLSFGIFVAATALFGVGVAVSGKKFL